MIGFISIVKRTKIVVNNYDVGTKNQVIATLLGFYFYLSSISNWNTPSVLKSFISYKK